MLVTTRYSTRLSVNPLPNDKNLNYSKLKEFAEYYSKFGENGVKFIKLVENTVRKVELFILSNFSCSHIVSKRLVPQTCKNKGLFPTQFSTLSGKKFAIFATFKLSSANAFNLDQDVWLRVDI